MKYSYLIYSLLLIVGLFSCGEAKLDAVVIENPSVLAFEQLEKELSSEKLSVNKNLLLPWKYLPIDSQFVMTNPVKYKRTTFADLPMTSRAYADSLGNEVLIYEWDLVEEGMSMDEKDLLKRDFENQHEIYVGKYNELIDRVTMAFGAPSYADKMLQSNNMEVYESYTSKNKWEMDKQMVEVSIFLLPNEIYRVALKNLILAQEKVVQ